MRAAQIRQIARRDERNARTRDLGNRSHIQTSSRMSAASNDGCSTKGRAVALAETAQDADPRIRLPSHSRAERLLCSLTPTRPVHVLPLLNDTEDRPSSKSQSDRFCQMICVWRTHRRTRRPAVGVMGAPGDVPGIFGGWRSLAQSDLTECWAVSTEPQVREATILRIYQLLPLPAVRAMRNLGARLNAIYHQSL